MICSHILNLSLSLCLCAPLSLSQHICNLPKHISIFGILLMLGKGVSWIYSDDLIQTFKCPLNYSTKS